MVSKKYIISNFYRILVDDKPVYVGYTNRTVKQRFKEHLMDKEFDSENVTVEQIDKLEFEFTWNYQKILEYSDIVSQRETELIIAQKTKNSIYQKGLGEKLGGSTWTNIKWFVKTNKDNPKYKDLSENEILSEIEKYRSNKSYIYNFISHMTNPNVIYLRHFINGMHDSDTVYLRSFISHMDSSDTVYLKHFINNMIIDDKRYLKDFINHMINSEKRYLQNFIHDMSIHDKKYLKDFVSHMISSDKKYLQCFVSGMVHRDKTYLRNFIGKIHR